MTDRSTERETLTLVECDEHPGAWRVETTGPDGESFVAEFAGSDAFDRANVYADWISEFTDDELRDAADRVGGWQHD